MISVLVMQREFRTIGYGKRVMNGIRGIIRILCQKTFRFWELLGIHVTPNHFFYPIPSTRDLDDAIFTRRSECVGIDWNIGEQTRYLREVFPKFALESVFKENVGLSLVDAAVLHSMVRYHQPRKIIEIGSGASTRFTAKACLMNGQEGTPCDLIAVEPYPNLDLERGFPGLSQLRREKVQSISVSEFEDCDLLFIDSSHVVKIGGDVNYEQLEILPRLKPGCLIHFHDILLPGEYWKDWVKEKRYFWSEQYLLWAFLLFNNKFEVIWASRYMHLSDSAGIKGVFPFFEPERDRITSFWIRRKR